MSDLINKFDVLTNLSDNFKQNIELFHIFGDYDYENNIWTEMKNVLIVTKYDEVFAFGGNTSGVLGLGHNNFVQRPTIVNELCNKNIVQFKIGWNHCMARTFDGKIYSFGMNFFNHLGIGKKDDDFHKPQLINDLNDMKIIDMCCGYSHSLVLTNLGEVYAWGSNYYGQIGIENVGNFQLFPIRVIGFKEERIIMISSGLSHSLALTECGHVFSWGNNDCGQLGYEKTNNERTRPEIVSVKDHKMNNVLINKISCGSKHNLLLTNVRDIYTFGCNEFGQLGDNSQVNRNKPLKLNIEKKFIDIATLNYSRECVAISSESVCYVWGNFDKNAILLPFETNFLSIVDIFNLEHGETYETIESFDCDLIEIKRYNKYFDEFEETNLIACASFGIVCKAMDRKDKNFYAIKKIPLKKNEIEVIRRELGRMIKLKSHYIVEYEFSWIEKNYFDPRNFENICNTNQDISSDHKIFDSNNTHLLHIQMELCLKTLNEVMVQLSSELNSKEMTSFQPIIYYILSELLNEILESIDFLHKQNIIHRNLKPPNILITDGINGRFIKITDFGLEGIHEIPDQSHTQCLGTFKYIAPEVLRTRKYDTKADIYSLGVTIHELFHLFTQMCIDTKNNALIEKKISNLHQLIDQMLSFDKSLRPDCQQLLLEKTKWYLSFTDLKDDKEFQRIISHKIKTKSLEECFHRFFIQQKVDFFFKSLTAVKQSIDIEDKNVNELWEMLNRFLSIER